MNKYLSFFRLRFIYGFQYRAAALAGIMTQFTWGALEILMFKAFYNADAKAFPMTFSALVSYVWMQQAFLALFMTWILENEIFDIITNGNIAYELCRPVDVYNMWFTRSMANRLSKALLRSMPILLFAVFLPAPYGLRLPDNGKTFSWFLLTMVLGFLTVIAYCMLLYIINFYTISPMGIRMVSVAVVEFFSGAVIPLPFFPKGIREIFEILPFASMQNVPLRIYSGDISGTGLYRAAGLQIFWVILLIVAGKILMTKALKKVVVQGG
ncbi:ABC-2 type transport system permease protein [Mobilisporobacter senegalensis]|uniref:ABC-2 type transport system permease protein n=1 Tax=Mobilisporobacter senegalensis TaxID=1329262 RepID=A0A3N1XAX0_9FIRM|nr:ABC-2 family transporter protein [Mobilisporobacter senegalensis]ROR23919.1 ABC-2 type transport system permease protein [Mobilisporobacter senegalensis]